MYMLENSMDSGTFPITLGYPLYDNPFKGLIKKNETNKRFCNFEKKSKPKFSVKRQN